jgi:AraC-like DNA-binding protein
MVISRQTASLPMTSAYFRLILGEYGRVARDRAALLAGTGVTEPEAEITLGQQLRQIQNANRLLPPDWALCVGARLHAATHGPVGTAVATAPTVRDALHVMTRYGWVRSPHFRMHAAVERDELRLVLEEQVALDEAERRALRDLVLLSTQGLLEAARGRPLHDDARVELPGPAARHHQPWFHAPVRYGRREAAVVIPVAWLDDACPLADPIAWAESMRRIVLEERRLAGAWVARVEQQVAAQRGRPDLDEVARALHVSRRTLVRRLADAGTTWRAVLEARQKRQAAALLREPGLGVAEVAWTLGYQDPSNFGRAFRRWFGVSPGTYRRRH